MNQDVFLKAIHGDLLDGAADAVPDESIDAAFFSPPYKTEDGYSEELMRILGATLGRVLKPSGMAFMNFGQLSDDFDRPFDARAALKAGAEGRLKTHQTITWIKSYHYDKITHGHFQPINSDYLLNYCFEFLFSYFKPPKPKLDKLSIGVPYMDKANLKRGTRGKNGDIHCGGDVWVLDCGAFDAQYVPYETTGAKTKKQHAYEFPEELVERAFKVVGLKPGQTIFEPFLGSGTTVAVAKKMGLNAYAVERDETTHAGALSRWDTTVTL